MGVQVLDAPSFRVQRALFVRLRRVTRSLQFSEVFALRGHLANFVFRSMDGNDRKDEESFGNDFRARGAFFVLLFIWEENCFMVNCVLFEDTMGVRVAFGAARPPRVLTLRVQANAPAMGLRYRHVLAFLRFVDSVPFNQYL